MGIVGIDIGNQKCAVSVFKRVEGRRRWNDPYLDWRLNHIRTIPTHNYLEPCPPTLVVFDAEHRRRFFGSTALDPNQTIPQIKRLIGRQFRDPQVQKELKQSILPFRITESPSDGSILIHVNYLDKPETFTPTQILGMVLSNLKATAETALESSVTECVIGIPCFFTPAQRRAVMDSAAIAKLPQPRLMHEITAGALFYSLCKDNLPENAAAGSLTVVFADVGHASTQISIVSVRKGLVKVLSHVSDSSLGGRDFDEILFRHFCGEFKAKYGMDVLSDKKACRKLRSECEKLKKDLSTQRPGAGIIEIDCFMGVDQITGETSRTKMEDLCKPLLERLRMLCERARAEAKISSTNIDAVEMLGLGSYIPAIVRVFATEFEKKPSWAVIHDATSSGAHQAVSGGCALQCALMSPNYLGCKPEFQIEDALPFSISLAWKEAGFALVLENETESGTLSSGSNIVLFSKGSPFPTQRMATFCNQKKHNFLTLDVLCITDDVTSGSPHKISTFTFGPFNAEKQEINLHISLDCNGMVSLQPAHDEAEEVVVSEAIVGSIDLQNAIDQESKMAKQDILMMETIDERNQLHSYLVDNLEKIYDVYEVYTTDEEKEHLTTKLQEALDWILQKSIYTEKSTYTDKLAEIKELIEPVERRAELLSCINEYRKKANDLNQSESSKAKSKILEKCEKMEKWLKDTLSQPQKNPMLLSDDIKKHTQTLERFCELTLEEHY